MIYFRTLAFKLSFAETVFTAALKYSVQEGFIMNLFSVLAIFEYNRLLITVFE